MRLEQWRTEFERCLRLLQKRPEDAVLERKSAPWKIAVACYLKQQTQASNRWLCDRLHMGTPVGVSQLVGQFRRDGGAASEYLNFLTEKPKT